MRAVASTKQLPGVCDKGGVLLSVAIVPLIVKAGSAWQKKRTDRLRAAFGPEYEECVNEHGDWRKAERVLLRRLRMQDRAAHSQGGGTPR